MSKLFTYVGIMAGVVLLFHVAGLIEAITPTSMLLTLLLEPENFSTGPFYNLIILGAMAAVGLTGIIVGIISRDFRFSAKTIMLTPLIAIGTDFVAVFNVIAVFNRYFALLILSPVIIMYIIVVAEWWTS